MSREIHDLNDENTGDEVDRRLFVTKLVKLAGGSETRGRLVHHGRALDAAGFMQVGGAALQLPARAPRLIPLPRAPAGPL